MTWKKIDNSNCPQPDKNKLYCVCTRSYEVNIPQKMRIIEREPHYLLATVITHPKDEELLQWKSTEFPNSCYDICEGDMFLEIERL